MWQGNVARTERHGNTLDIIVSYSNGTNTFDETITTDRAQTDDWLSNQITARLNQLNALDDYETNLSQNPIITTPVLSIDPATGSISQLAEPPVIDPPITPIDVPII